MVVGQVVDGLGVLDEIERRAAADKDGEVALSCSISIQTSSYSFNFQDPREHVEISDCGFEH